MDTKFKIWDEVERILKPNFFDEEIPKLLKKFFFDYCHHFSDEYAFGRNRVVFYCKHFVVKLPITDAGLSNNEWEGSVSNSKETRDNGEDVQYPRTKLFYIGENAVPIVLMEKVSFPDNDFVLPDWANSVDCGQVGFTRTGRLVAFDYGDFA